MEWGERELVLLLNQKRGDEGECTGSATAAAPRDGVARAQESQGGGARAVLGLGATRGAARSWRWHRGAAEAQQMAGEAALTPAAEEQRAKQRRCQRRKKREGGPRGLIGNYKNLRDCTVNRNFPLIQSSNEEMVKIEVVELLKSYNSALGLQFRNLKHNVLFYHFALKLIFT
jgi:hypothetical protein